MVRLLLDIGNSACKRAGYDGDIDNLHVYSPVEPTVEDIISCVPASGVDFDSITISSVRNEKFNRQLSQMLQANFALQPIFVSAKYSVCGVTTAYRPDQLGGDRFAALLGAWYRCQDACIVVDCGTAVTVDAINANGEHQGGGIMPGLHLLRQALRQGTDCLPALGVDSKVWGEEGEDNVFACDTESAIITGCRKMFVGAIAMVVQEMRVRLGDAATLFITGGDAVNLLDPHDMVVRRRPYLVLEGVAVFSDRVRNCG